MELLGDRVWRRALVLFTRGVWLGGRRVEEYITAEGEPLRSILEKCGYRYQVLDCINLDVSEVKELMEKVEDMVTRNRGHFGPADSREDTGHLSEGRETFTAAEWNRREEEWRREKEEMVEKMLQFAEKDQEEPALLPLRRRRSKEWTNPSCEYQ